MARRAFLLGFSFFLLVPLTGAGQPAPVAPPFLVDPDPARSPADSAVAFMDDGRFVLVWTVWAVPTGSEAELFARTFDAAGRPTSEAILLTGPPARPQMVVVARGAAESWIVVWQDREGLVGRRVDAGDGTPLSEVFQITDGEVSPDGPALCSDASGRFVVAWRPSFTAGDIFARRFDADTARRGGPLTVARDARTGPGIACAADGRFAVGWVTNTSHCRVALYGGGGHREGDPQRVDTERVFFYAAPRLAMTPGGELAVVWGLPPHTRFFDAAGQSLGPPIVQAPRPGDLSEPWDVVSLSESTFLLLWSEWDFARPYARILSRRFNAVTGQSLGGGLFSEVWGTVYEMRAGGDAGGHLALISGPYGQVFDAVHPGFLELDRPALAAGEGDREVVFTVRRTGGSGAAVDVDYATVPVTARPGEDYVPASGTLSFPAGDSQPRTLSVRLLDDRGQEAEETVAVVLSNPTGGAGLGSLSRTELAIRDDDGPSPLRGRGAPIEVSPGDVTPAYTPVAALAADGSFAVAWRRGYEVLAQRFTRRGAPQGELSGAGIESEYPALAAHPDRGFTLVWQHNSYIDVTGEIVKHGYGAAHLFLQHAPARGEWGAPVLLEVGPGVFHGPRLTYVDLAAFGRKRLLAGGRFGGDSFETLVFDTAGELMRPRPAVVAGAGDLLGSPAFGLRPDGSGLVLAGKASDGSAAGIAGAFVRGDGRLRGALFPVNSGVSGIQESPDVVALSNGLFLAVWQSLDLPGEHPYVAGRLLTREGVPLGPDLRISTSLRFDHLVPKVAALGDGALVVWESRGEDGTSEIHAQVVAASGRLQGRELRIGGPTSGARHQPGVAANAAGQAVVVWLEVDDGSRTSIRLQRLVP